MTSPSHTYISCEKTASPRTGILLRTGISTGRNAELTDWGICSLDTQPPITGNARTEYGQHKTGNDLISSERDGYKGIYKRTCRTRSTCRQHSEQRISRSTRNCEAERRTHKHHTLDTEVHMTYLFTKYTADNGKQYRSTCLNGSL